MGYRAFLKINFLYFERAESKIGKVSKFYKKVDNMSAKSKCMFCYRHERIKGKDDYSVAYIEEEKDSSVLCLERNNVVSKFEIMYCPVCGSKLNM